LDENVETGAHDPAGKNRHESCIAERHPRMTLAQLFDLSFVRRRSEPALEAGRTWTFGEIDVRSSQMAHALLARGVRAGDRLCVYLRNSADFIILYVAATRLGAVLVPMNVLYRDRELRHIITDADPVAVIAGEDAAPSVPDVAPVWTLEALVHDAARCPGSLSIEPAADGDCAAMIVYTSGTTGSPKGAVLTQAMLGANAVNLVACWRISAADRFLLTLPLFHVHGLAFGVHCWLTSGCLLRLEERFDRQAVEEQMTAFSPTLFFGVPTMYVRMLEFREKSARAIGRKMRLFVSGSAPLPTQVWTNFRERFGHTILERYGMTETLVNTSNPYAGERRAGSVGVALPGVLVRTFDAEGSPVPDGTTGEICVRGPNVLREYWRNPAATADAFRDGWFRTGDLGTRARDGYFTLQGRKSDLIISGGFNIYPREVEDFLCEQPGVAEAAVTGAADGVRGEVPVAYVVPTAAWDQVRVERACREHLASFKIPREFILVERLPRTPLGKVQKQLLAKRK
jgi:malonyl-CoA/methylmalonyl-CoA synthetase